MTKHKKSKMCSHHKCNNKARLYIAIHALRGSRIPVSRRYWLCFAHAREDTNYFLDVILDNRYISLAFDETGK